MLKQKVFLSFCLVSASLGLDLFTASAASGSWCNSTGNVNIYSTVLVSSQDYDGGCRTFHPSTSMGDGSQDENQDPAFRVENGATLKNVIIGYNGVDGIHVYNGGTLDNIHWTNVGEDAVTIKSSGNVYVRNFEGYNGSDKFFQINAPSNLYVDNCIVHNMGKFLRQSGGTYFQINVSVNNCQIANMGEGIFRTDSYSSTAKITNSQLHNAGSICIGNWASCWWSGITWY